MDAQIIAATRLTPASPIGLITIRLDGCPEFLHAQLLRHRRVSPNWISHRVGDSEQHLAYYLPDTWYAAAKGMAVGGPLPAWRQTLAGLIARTTNAGNALAVRALIRLGVTPSQAGRYNNHTHGMTGVLTATERAWRALLDLRQAEDADPAAQQIARIIERRIAAVEWAYGSEHLPYFDPALDSELELTDRVLVCAARIARVSYGQAGKRGGELRLGRRLLNNRHWSPFDQCGVWRLGRDLPVSPLCSLPEDTATAPGGARGGWLSGRQLFDPTPAFHLDELRPSDAISAAELSRWLAERAGTHLARGDHETVHALLDLARAFSLTPDDQTIRAVCDRERTAAAMHP